MESPFLVNELRVAERSDLAAAILFSAERPSPQGEVSGGHRRDSPPSLGARQLLSPPDSDVRGTKEKRKRNDEDKLD